MNDTVNNYLDSLYVSPETITPQSFFSWEWLLHLVFQCTISFACIFGIDKICKVPEKARWWFLHTVINAFVVLTSYQDVKYCLFKPSNCFIEQWVSTWPCMIIYAGHLYHVVFFRDIRLIDWVHHILMVFVMIPITMTYQTVHGSNLGAFGLSGLPGGLDFLLLTLVKSDLLHPLYEKMLNVIIQVWIRMPILVLGTGWWWIAFVEGDLDNITFITGFLTLWNAVYFMHDTVQSFYVKHYKSYQELPNGSWIPINVKGIISQKLKSKSY